MINDDKTVVGDSSFGKPNSEQTNNGENKIPNNANTSSNSKVTEPLNNQSNVKNEDNKKISKGAAIGGAAAVGVAAAVAGAVFSDDIKKGYDELTGKEVEEKTEEAIAETSTDPQSFTTASTLEPSGVIVDPTTDPIGGEGFSDPEGIICGDPIPESTVEGVMLQIEDEAGVHSINLIDVDYDGIADTVQLIEDGQIVNEYTSQEFQAVLTGQDFIEPDPSLIDEGMLGNEGITDGGDLNVEGQEDLYADIDYAVFEDESLPNSEFAVTDDSNLAFEEPAMDYIDDSASTTEDYMLEESSQSDNYLASNDEYQNELNNMDFDAMDNSDYSTDSFDTDFSGDLI